MRIDETILLCDTHDTNERRPLLQNQHETLEIRNLNLPQVNINRRLYLQETLKVDAAYRARSLTVGRTMRKIFRNCEFAECFRHSIPIIQWLPKYKINDFLIKDIIAGITAAIMHIPQGMAYALLAEAPPIMGLYMAFFPVLIYVILGNSPHVSMGTFAVACLMSGKVVLEHANKPSMYFILIYLFHMLKNQLTNVVVPAEDGNVYSPIEVLSTLSFMVGMFQIAMWSLRLGAIASLLSDPMVSGFTTGASLHVCASQLKDLFGVKLPPLATNFKVINTVIEMFKHLGNTNLAVLLMSFITCLLLALNNEHLKPWLRKRTRLPLPAELVAVVAGTLVSHFLNLPETYNITVIGTIPTGLPVPSAPPLELMGGMIVDGCTQTMVTYTITLSMGLIFAAREKYEIDANQELLAMGASNLFGSFFSCGPMCASLSRSYIQYTAGGKTLITTVVCATLMLLVLLWIGPLFEQLPRCVLASVIVVSLKGLFMQVLELAKFNKLSKIDAMVWLFTFLVTVVVNIDIGLFAGLLASVGSLFLRAQTAYVCLLGRLDQTDIYLDVKRYRGVQEIPGIKIFHYNGSLNFTSKNLFRSKLFRKIYHYHQIEIAFLHPTKDTNIASAEWKEHFPIPLQCVIFDASGLSYMDVPGLKMMVSVQNELAMLDVTLLLASVSEPIREMIEKFNSLESDKLNALIFPSIHDAVLYSQAVKHKSPAQIV